MSSSLAEARWPTLEDGHLRLLTFNMQVGIQTSAYHHYLTRSWQHLLPHPQRKPKVTEHGKSWAERIRALDALIIVTPQYNGAYPGSLKTAIDWLYAEWNRLPTLLVGYGWGAADEVLPMLESLMVRVGAGVVGSPGLDCRQDRSEEHTSELQSRGHLVCSLLIEK